MLSTQAFVPALVLLSLFLAASASPTAPANSSNETTNEVEIVPPPSGGRGNPLVVDYRKSRCMPPFTDEFIFFDNNYVTKCVFGSWALTAASLAEYVECKLLKLPGPRDFSVRQLLECVNEGYLAKLVNCDLPHCMPDQDAFNYIFYNGLALNSTYLAGKEDTILPEPSICAGSNSDTAFQFKKGYRTIKQNDEQMMARILVDGRQPIIATLYFKPEYIENPPDDKYLIDFKSGILDHEKVCVKELSPIPTNDMLFKTSVMVVGYRKENGVKVWILRNDWFGADWGMGGYFYLKRGVNACHIALNTLYVLD